MTRFDVQRPTIVVVFLALFALGLGSGCGDDSGSPPAVAAEAAFEQFWTDFDRTYSYFERKGIDWDDVYARYRPRVVDGQTSQRELADMLGEIVLSFRDLHVSLVAGQANYFFQNRSTFAANSPDNAIEYLSEVFGDTSAVLYGTLEGANAIYVRIKTLNNSADFSPLDQALSDFGSYDGVVLDLRDNGGGSEDVARAVVSRITTEERLFRRVRVRNGPGRNDFEPWRDSTIEAVQPIASDLPIMVLTNRGTVSSAEGFVAMLRVLPNTRIIGDTTRGSTGNPGEFTLANGWRYRISRWQAALPDGQLIEDEGIAPDVAVTNTNDSMAEGRDLILEAALARLP